MSNYYFGSTPEQLLGDTPRFLYALHRTDDGDLYFNRVDSLTATDSIQINTPGVIEDDYNDFETGVDFFEGRDIYHNLVYPNLNYEQYRWDTRSIFYYIDAEGDLVARVNQGYNYPNPEDA